MSGEGALGIRQLTPALIDDLAEVTRGSWGASCYCMFPRLTDRETRALPGNGPPGERRRRAMTEAAQSRPPGLLGYDAGRPVGWIAVGPRHEYSRVARSRATPPVDGEDVWVIPCITVTKRARGCGIAVALIRAAVVHAGEHGVAAVEAYPRAGARRVVDGSAYFGTEPMFRRAGFAVVRPPLPGLPKTWLPRVTMRATPALTHP